MVVLLLRLLAGRLLLSCFDLMVLGFGMETARRVSSRILLRRGVSYLLRMIPFSRGFRPWVEMMRLLLLVRALVLGFWNGILGRGWEIGRSRGVPDERTRPVIL